MLGTLFYEVSSIISFIRMMTCFLDGPLVVIWIQGLGLGPSIMMFCIWLIFFALRAGKVSFILMTSSV